MSSLQPSFRPTPGTAFPTRLKRLLWVVCLNGGLMALEGTLQRLSGTNKLLWMLEPEKGAFNRSQFGPFDYYANAAQYLNLVWPVCLALWWCLHEARRDSARGALRAGGSPHVLLLPAVGFLFAAAIFAGSRGGALVASGLFLASAVLLIAASTPRTRRIGLVSMALLALVAGGAAKLGGGQALSRLLAPPAYFSTGVEGGMSDFSLDYLLDCPTEGRPSWWYLAYLTPAPSDQSRSSAFLYMSGQALGLLIHGIPDTNRITLLCTNFVGEFGGRRVKVTAVKEGTNLSLYADGRQLSVVTYPSRFPPLTNQVGSSFLRVQRDPDPDPRRSAEDSTVHQVRLYTNALSPTQVVALAKASSEEAGGAINVDQTPRPVLDISRRVLTSPSSLGNQLRSRTEIHKVGRSMASDFPWFGSGPGTFGPLFQLYRREAHVDWQWQAHNDWLETRITFGRAGLGFVLLALALVPVCHFTRQGASVPAVFVGLVWLALAGCLAHARFDYPFQVHSVLFAFLVWSAAASVVSGRR